MILLDQKTQAPLVAARIGLVSAPAAGDEDRPHRIRIAAREVSMMTETDAAGRADFCAVPPNAPLQLVLRDRDGRFIPVTTLQMKSKEIGARTVRAATPAPS